MEIVSRPFADFCNITFPGDEFEDAQARIVEVVHAAGGYSEHPSVMRVGDGGTVKHGKKFSVGSVGVSGAALAALRSCGMFRELLGAVALSPHRVTLLHATVDVAEDGPRAVHRVWRRALRGKMKLTRKAIPRGQVRRLLSAGLVDGRQTGTVYLGNRKRDVSAKVYDKREQLLSRVIDEHTDLPAVLALNDPGPLTRYELQLGRHVGVTLRDVEDPSAVFWHHCGDALLPRPSAVQEWVAGAEGFEMPERGEVDYVRQLELLLENSPDVHRMVMLADKISPREGRQWLYGKLEKLRLPGSGMLPTIQPKGVV